MKTAKVFTEKEKLLIASLYVNGKSSNAIAKEFHISPNRVMEIIKTSGASSHSAGRKRTRIRKPKMEKIQHNKPVEKVKVESKDDVIINLLSMPEEYNVKEVERLQKFIHLEMVPNVVFGGIRFDLAIPELGMLVVTCPTEEEYNQWRKRVGEDAYTLSDIMREYHYSSVDKSFKGDEALCKEVKKRYEIIHRFH